MANPKMVVKVRTDVLRRQINELYGFMADHPDVVDAGMTVGNFREKGSVTMYLTHVCLTYGKPPDLFEEEE